jgi:NADPH-dependent 2,4-dienoyl-CoA reductase/sulfur reductase-like enzyme
VKIPPGGIPENGDKVQIELTNGDFLTTDMVLMATGQSPNNGLVAQLAETSGTSLVNPANGCIFVKPTLQLKSEKFPNIFSLGDIADTGSHKAARPGAQQAGVVARNIVSMIQNGEPAEEFKPTPAGIHLSLGIVCLPLCIPRHLLKTDRRIETQYHFPQPALRGCRPDRHGERRVSASSTVTSVPNP